MQRCTSTSPSWGSRHRTNVRRTFSILSNYISGWLARYLLYVVDAHPTSALSDQPRRLGQRERAVLAPTHRLTCRRLSRPLAAYTAAWCVRRVVCQLHFTCTYPCIATESIPCWNSIIGPPVGESHVPGLQMLVWTWHRDADGGTASTTSTLRLFDAGCIRGRARADLPDWLPWTTFAHVHMHLAPRRPSRTKGWRGRVKAARARLPASDLCPCSPIHP